MVSFPSLATAPAMIMIGKEARSEPSGIALIRERKMRDGWLPKAASLLSLREATPAPQGNS